MDFTVSEELTSVQQLAQQILNDFTAVDQLKQIEQQEEHLARSERVPFERPREGCERLVAEPSQHRGLAQDADHERVGIRHVTLLRPMRSPTMRPG